MPLHPADYGSVYASTIFKTADSRQLMISWVQDTAAGCADSCSDQLPPVIERMGFKGVHTVMRQLSYDSATRSLRAYPVKEMELLRGAKAGPKMLHVAWKCSEQLIFSSA
jgi:sucrose-6-phosphate hydrolase SacC (GH32 family)